jgi:hypothetical protein
MTNIAKIVPGTFKTEQDMTNLNYREEVEGVVTVEFEGKTFETKATFTAGVDIIIAHGFVGQAKTGKVVWEARVSYRVKSDEHDCRLGGAIALDKMWYDPEAKIG